MIVGVLVVILLGLYAALATTAFLIDPRSFSFPDPHLGYLIVIGTVILWTYLTIGWWATGRTYGKHVMGLRVVNFDGERMHLLGAALRAAFCIVFPIGLFWVLVSSANRSVQDVVLRSSVPYDWSPRRVSPVAARDDDAMPGAGALP